MNTRISYMYRDACNYKEFNEEIIGGELTLEEIKPYLRDGEYFIPSEVRLRDLQPRPPTLDDHPWHEFGTFEATTEEPTVKITRVMFLPLLRRAHKFDWNEIRACKRIGLYDFH